MSEVGIIKGLRATAASGGGKGVKKLGRNLALCEQSEAQSISSNPARRLCKKPSPMRGFLSPISFARTKEIGPAEHGEVHYGR